MKKEIDYSIFMNKLQKIYEKCIKKEMKHPSVYIVNMLNPNKNKLSSKERKAKSQLKKQQQQQACKEKYGDTEYKRLHAQKIAEQRQKKKEAETQTNVRLDIYEYSTDDEGL
jgi:hypothetical protein